jgi:hypothetical protein
MTLVWTEPDWCTFRGGPFEVEIYPADDGGDAYDLQLTVSRKGRDWKDLAQKLQDVLDGNPILTREYLVDEFLTYRSVCTVSDRWNALAYEAADRVLDRLEPL